MASKTQCTVLAAQQQKVKVAYLLLQHGPRVWTGVMQAGSMMAPFNTPSSILDLPVGSGCSLAFEVMDQKIRIMIGLMPSASPPRWLVSFDWLGSYQSINSCGTALVWYIEKLCSNMLTVTGCCVRGGLVPLADNRQWNLFWSQEKVHQSWKSPGKFGQKISIISRWVVVVLMCVLLPSQALSSSYQGL